MKKRLVGLILALALVFSLNTVTFAEPGGGAFAEPNSITLPGGYFEDCQGEDDDQN